MAGLHTRKRLDSPIGSRRAIDSCVQSLAHVWLQRLTLTQKGNIMTKEPRRYGVSIGNGNDGVSHMFARYYVTTDSPWRLARLAALSEFKAGEGHTWAARNVEIDGDSEFGISATFYNPPCEDTTSGEYPEVEDGEDAEDGRNWCETNGAWLIVEVFPENEPRNDRPSYTSLEDAFDAAVLALVPVED